ncbi:hypothetical protein [Streptomyces sp. NBC_01264]|uniref:hypothetical protein n=1 Tax=Streptomyces sp. NBC_01264 TaxID=2903804 RepID=UPI002259054D|nr:hypothetical protein [Streptomyces sp. NBC_01264]MCX4778199.1 hypothetical protein [Streptomyces sp. NBC_01264]
MEVEPEVPLVARDFAARPSTTGSPQPTTPSSVSARTDIQRGGAMKVPTRVIFTADGVLSS